VQHGTSTMIEPQFGHSEAVSMFEELSVELLGFLHWAGKRRWQMPEHSRGKHQVPLESDRMGIIAWES
jgi:hypothetical protein